MKHKHSLIVSLLLLGLLSLVFLVHTSTADDKAAQYKFLGTISVPSHLGGGFDISWVDSALGRYYLADRGNSTVSPAVPPAIDIIDTKSLKFLGSVALPAAPNGVVAIHRSGFSGEEEGVTEVWAGDAASMVDVINPDPKTGSVLARINTGGTARADELAFDPLDHIILVANDNDLPPFVTFISTKTRTVLGKIFYPQTVFGTPPTGHGLEQPVWDGKTKTFFFAVPATSTNPNGEIDEINPKSMMVTKIYPTTCNPAGLALLPGQNLITSCGDVLDIESGHIVTVAGTGGDEIWFNPGDERVYFGGGLNRISVPVVDTELGKCFSPHLLTTLTVGSGSDTTHSVAADNENNRVFVPIRNEGVKVYADEDRDDRGDR